jgi:hypothetical protein
MRIQMVPRIEDLPYYKSPPIEFTYTSSAPFAAGKYTWADRPSALTPNRPLMVNSLYYFRSITLSADIEETDFTSAIVTIPQFQMYLKSRAKTILFREPVYMLKFMQNFDYRFAWITQQVNDQLFASFNGVINQTPGTVGKDPLKLTAIISAQEVVDEGFIKLFKETYPTE